MIIIFLWRISVYLFLYFIKKNKEQEFKKKKKKKILIKFIINSTSN